MIKYLGSKRTLTPLLERLASRLPIGSACDLFAGTTRVGQAFRRAGAGWCRTTLATYSEAFGHAYVTETLCRQARYFSPDNGARIDAMRDAIDELTDDPALRGACSRA